jgi:hypothetical protein
MNNIHKATITLYATAILGIGLGFVYKKYQERVAKQEEAENAANCLENKLKKGGFSNSETYFTNLNAKVPTNPKIYFRQEECTNMMQREIDFCLEYHVSVKNTENAMGWSTIVYDSSVTGYFYLVSRNLHEIDKEFIRAQQNGRYIWNVDKKFSIFKQFENPYTMDYSIRTEEDFSILCGWIATIRNHDIATIDFTSEDPKKTENFKRIKEIMKTFKLK